MKRCLNYFTFLILTIHMIFTFLCIAPYSFAADFAFKWDANHPHESVIAYRIYWRTSSGNYNSSDREEIPISRLSDPDNPQWRMSIPGFDPNKTYYFVCTAVNNHGYESAYSNEINTSTLNKTDTTPPAFTSLPSVSNITHDAATISWETNENSDGEVRYDDDANSTWSGYSHNKTSSNLVTNHDVVLTGLAPDTTYYYRVRSTDAANNSMTSSQLWFQTSEAPDTSTPPAPENPPPPEPDTIPPAILSAATSNISDNRAVVQWTTDEDSDSEVRYGISSGAWEDYEWHKSDETLVSTHTILLSGLSAGQKYFYRVASIDSSGNQVISTEYEFTTLTDDHPATLEFTSPPTVTDVTDTTATIAWSTNETSGSLVQYDTVSRAWDDYFFEANSSNPVTDHVMTLTDLTAHTQYYFRVCSVSIESDGLLISNEVTFNTDQTTDEDEPTITAPPTVISMYTPNTAIQSWISDNQMMTLARGSEKGTVSVALSWKTDELSNSEVRYGRNSTTWDNYPYIIVVDELVKNHTVIMTNLVEGQRYYFRVGSTDALGNGPSNNPDEKNNPFKEQNFTVVLAPDPDKEAPRIISHPEVIAIDNASAVILWETDEPSNSIVQFGLANAEWDGFTDTIVDSKIVSTHNVAITGLQPTTRYYFIVGSVDISGNGPDVNDNLTNPSAADSFWTTDIVDQTPPNISNIEMTYVSDTTTIIEWETDEPSNSMIQYDLSSREWGDYSHSVNDQEMATSHSMTITNLQPHTTYYYRVGSADAKGNGPSYNPNQLNPSEEQTFMSAEGPDEDAPQISQINIFENVSERSATIEWTTDEPGNSLLKYDITSQEWENYAYNVNVPEMKQNHSVTVFNLEPDVPYYIRISSVDASGNNHDTASDDRNPSPEYVLNLDSDTISVDPPRVPPHVKPPIEEQTGECFINTTLNIGH